jgi:hypothetical protein
MEPTKLTQTRVSHTAPPRTKTRTKRNVKRSFGLALFTIAVVGITSPGSMAKTDPKYGSECTKAEDKQRVGELVCGFDHGSYRWLKDKDWDAIKKSDALQKAAKPRGPGLKRK